MNRIDEDSLFWRIERACASLQYEVAASHARKGGSAVILTNRRAAGVIALEQDLLERAEGREPKPRFEPLKVSKAYLVTPPKPPPK